MSLTVLRFIAVLFTAVAMAAGFGLPLGADLIAGVPSPGKIAELP